MRALGICLLCWKLASVSCDSTIQFPDPILRVTETLENLQNLKLDPSKLHFDELENQTVLDGLTIHEAETETKLKIELTRLQHRSRWKRCSTCEKSHVTIRSVQTRSRRYNTYLNNKVVLLQRTVGKLTLSLQKTKSKIKSYEKWKKTSEMRFRKLEAMMNQLKGERGNLHSPGALTSNELHLISSDYSPPVQQNQNPTSSTRELYTNSRRRSTKRTTSTNFSMNGNVLSFQDVATTVVSLNSSLPIYRTVLYKLNSRVSRFNKYMLRRQQSLRRMVSSSMSNNHREIGKIYSKILDLTKRIESSDFVDSVRNATVDRVLDEIEPDLSSLLHQSLDDLNDTYHGKIEALNEKVALNKGTVLAWSRRMANVRSSNIRMRKNIQKSMASLKNSTRTKVLWQNRLLSNTAASLSKLRRDTEDKIDSISNLAIDTRFDLESLNRSLKAMHQASSKDESQSSSSSLDRKITEIQSTVDVLQGKQSVFDNNLKSLMLESIVQSNNVTEIKKSLNGVFQRLERLDLHVDEERETLRELASCCKESAGLNPIPNATFVEPSSNLPEASLRGNPPSPLRTESLHLDESSIATLQRKLEEEVENRIEIRMKTIGDASRHLKQINSDIKTLTESVKRMNSTFISDYVTSREYQLGAEQMEHRLEATISQRIEELHELTQNDTALLENRLLELENTTVISDETLHQVINSSEILKEQMEKLHFFRAFVFLKLGATKGKNLSQLEATINRMREDIDFNYNSTQLITDFVRGQDSQIALLSNEIQDVLPLSESVEEQKISLEELNYTLTERQNQISHLLHNLLAAFDTSNYVVKRLRQDLDFMKKNTSNHFIRSFTNLDYLTRIVEETNIAVRENSDRLEDMNNTLIFLELSYNEPVSPQPDGGLLPEWEPPAYDSSFPPGIDNWEEPGLVSVDDESSLFGNLTGVSDGVDGNEEETSTSEDLEYYFTPGPGNRVGRSILKSNTNLGKRLGNSIGHLTDETNSIKISPIAGQVAFSVGLTTTFDCCGPVRFNKVFANKGGRYDALSGKFTADLAGHYVFYVTVSKKNSFVHAALVHNDISTISIRMEHSSGSYHGQNQSSNSVVLVMEPGDQVWLQTYSGSLKGYPSPSTTFSGFLISE